VSESLEAGVVMETSRQSGIRTHLLALCAVALVPLFGLIAWEIHGIRNDGRVDATTETIRLSRIAAERTSAGIAAAETALDAAIRSEQWSPDEETCTALVEYVRKLVAQADAAFVTDATGALVCADGASADLVLLDLDALSAALNAPDGDVVFGSDPSGGLLDDPTSVVLRAIPGSDDLVVGAALEFGSELERFGLDYALEPGSIVAILDDRGVVLSSSTDRGEGRRAPMQRIVDQIVSGGVEGTVDDADQAEAELAAADGIERYYSYVDVMSSSGSLFAVVGTPVSSIDSAVSQEMTRRLFAIGLGLLLAFGAAAVLAEVSVARPLRTIRDRLARIGAGDLSARSTEKIAIRELAEVDADIDVMAQSLEQRAHALQQATEERHRLLDELLSVQDEERRRIAADIHDDTIQSMIASGLSVQLLRHEVTDPDALERLRTVEQRIGASIGRLRQLMFELEPVGVAGDLTAAIEQYLESALDRPVQLSVTCSDHLEPVGPVRQVIFRNLRECVLNASRHGGADSIDVDISLIQGGIEVIVSDDGSGMASSSARKAGHHGMRMMRERVEALGGHLMVESELGRGTTVLFWIPNSQAPQGPGHYSVVVPDPAMATS
jgi:signal transduction histidine kinase